jgi:hypothetical protein
LRKFSQRCCALGNWPISERDARADSVDLSGSQLPGAGEHW